MSYSLDKLIEEEGRLFSLPQLASKINSIVNDPEATFEELGEVISQDVGLSTQLLKIVNSGLYNFQEPVETITHAISVVGMVQLRDLAMGTIIIDAFKGIPSDVISMRSFWEHSIATGIAAQILVIYKKEINPERFYLAGLLHEIGRLVLFSKFQKESGKIVELSRENKTSMYIVENEFFELDHCIVGGALLASWNLPEYQQEAAKFHHRPQESEKYGLETSIVHVGDVIAHILGLGNSGEHFVPHIEVKAWDKIGLPVDILPNVFKMVEERYYEVISTYMG